MGNLFSYDNPVIQFLTKVANCVYLNILWFIFSIPIFTIGASTTALYYVSLKMVKDQESGIFSAFFSSFKENFKQSTIIWLIMLVLGIILGVDGYIFFQMYAKSALWTVGTALFLSISLIYITILLYIFPLQSRFENKIFITFKNSILIGVRYFIFTILILIIHIVMLVVTFIFPPIILFGMGLCAFMSSYLFSWIFQRIEQMSQK